MTQADGEKELVLGNRQLISLFFVVVALCGVFFAMGYLIGRNSTKGIVASAPSGEEGSAANTAPPAAPALTEAAPTSAAPAADSAGGPESQPSAIQTQPARDTPGQPVAAPAPPANTASAVVTPEVGATYLQVAAQHRADADNLVKTLREQSLPAVVAASSKEDLFRVLVGPYHETAQVAEAKDKLKALGFANAFVQKQ
jgi:cell division septation protein DedD